MRHRTVLVTLALFTVVASAFAADWGRFEGNVLVEWLDDGRRMQLLEDFAYIDPASMRWLAPRRSTIDGASIPRALWALIGGPYEGKYRNASVVHDVECKTHAHRWKDVHRMFYNAMRCGGVQWLKAKIMYGAVYHFGPRWPNPSARLNARHPAVELASFAEEAVPERETFMRDPRNPQRMKANYLRMKAFIEKNPEATLEQIESLTEEKLRPFGDVQVPPLTLNEQYPDPPEGKQ